MLTFFDLRPDPKGRGPADPPPPIRGGGCDLKGSPAPTRVQFSFSGTTACAGFGRGAGTPGDSARLPYGCAPGSAAGPSHRPTPPPRIQPTARKAPGGASWIEGASQSTHHVDSWGRGRGALGEGCPYATPRPAPCPAAVTPRSRHRAGPALRRTTADRPWGHRNPATGW